MVLECIPAGVGGQDHEALKIPTIGIGAGADCDGQVLVINDLLGITSGYVPKFVKAYADLKATITDAVTRFRDDVRERKVSRARIRRFNSDVHARADERADS